MKARFYGSSKIKAIYIPFSSAGNSLDLFPNYEISIEKNKHHLRSSGQSKFKRNSVKSQVWAS